MKHTILRSLWLGLLLSTLLSACRVASTPRNSSSDQLVTISTPQGDIRLVLSDLTPQHKANFLQLAKSGYYNGTTFHRVIPNFMIQGGDPNTKDSDPSNDGLGPANGKSIPAELVAALRHQRGAVAAARLGDNVNPQRASSASQFYIVQNPRGTPQLDGAYTVFGQVVSGMEVVDAIVNQARDPRDRPLTDVKVTVKVEKMKKKDITARYGYQYP